jgi:hypothetical protein
MLPGAPMHVLLILLRRRRPWRAAERKSPYCSYHIMNKKILAVQKTLGKFRWSSICQLLARCY